MRAHSWRPSLIADFLRRSPPRCILRAAVALCLTLAVHGVAQAGAILFVGNSFTFGHGSPVASYRANTVTDLNGQGMAGMPALFKSFSSQAGLQYDVHIEAQPGVGLDWHLKRKLAVIGQRAWDTVVLHGYSTLDAVKPGDATLLLDTVKRMADAVHKRNSAVDIRLLATWPRADQTYEAHGHWYGRPINAMATDLRLAYAAAAANSPYVKGVIPVGDAWVRAFQTGVADPNPYDGIERGSLNLWADDHYHASAFGSYLEALVVFGSITGRDPRSLGANECSGFELGFTPAQVAALQRVAFDELKENAIPMSAAPSPAPAQTVAGPCPSLQ